MLVIDIETVPDPSFTVGPGDVKVPGSYRKPEAIAAFRNDPRNIEAELRNRSKSPFFGKVLSVGWSCWDMDEDMNPCSGFLAVETVLVQNEHALLSAVWDAWQPILADGHSLAAINGYKFDFQFLAWRAMAHGLHPMARAMKPPKKWSPTHIDPSLDWGFTSLATMCQSLRVTHPSAGQGKFVFDWHKLGEENRIRAHNEDDVRASNMVLLLMWRSGLIAPRR